MSIRTYCPVIEQCENRSLMTLVFVLNGNGYAQAKPNALTANAAQVLDRAGVQVIQLANPNLSTPTAIHRVARQMASLAHGRPIGIVGFSAGGALAIRLASDNSLVVKDVLDFYGPPDLGAFLANHYGDRFARGCG